MHNLIGSVFIVAGVFGGAWVHSMRPPEGIGEAFARAAQGGSYIKEPYYQGALAFCGLLAVGGVLRVSGLDGAKKRAADKKSKA